MKHCFDCSQVIEQPILYLVHVQSIFRIICCLERLGIENNLNLKQQALVSSYLTAVKLIYFFFHFIKTLDESLWDHQLLHFLINILYRCLCDFFLPLYKFSSSSFFCWFRKLIDFPSLFFFFLIHRSWTGLSIIYIYIYIYAWNSSFPKMPSFISIKIGKLPFSLWSGIEHLFPIKYELLHALFLPRVTRPFFPLANGGNSANFGMVRASTGKGWVMSHPG